MSRCGLMNSAISRHVIERLYFTANQSFNVSMWSWLFLSFQKCCTKEKTRSHIAFVPVNYKYLLYEENRQFRENANSLPGMEKEYSISKAKFSNERLLLFMKPKTSIHRCCVCVVSSSHFFKLLSIKCFNEEYSLWIFVSFSLLSSFFSIKSSTQAWISRHSGFFFNETHRQISNGVSHRIHDVKYSFVVTVGTKMNLIDCWELFVQKMNTYAEMISLVGSCNRDQ